MNEHHIEVTGDGQLLQEMPAELIELDYPGLQRPRSDFSARRMEDRRGQASRCP